MHPYFSTLPPSKRWPALLAYWLICIILGFVVLSWWAFQARNPKANNAAFYVHTRAVLTWQRLPEFQ